MSLYHQLKNRGVIHCAELLFNRIVPPWVFRFSLGIVLELDVEKLVAIDQTIEKTGYYTSCVVDPQAREQLRATTWNSVPAETSRSHFGYCVCRDESPHVVIGGVWGGIDRFNEADLGFQINLAPDQAWIYCAYVNKDARGDGVYKRVLSFAANDLQSRGYKRLRVIIQPWNKASLHIHSKYSSRVVGRILAIRIFRLALVFCTGELSKSKTSTTRLLHDPVIIQLR